MALHAEESLQTAYDTRLNKFRLLNSVNFKCLMYLIKR